MPGFVVFAVAAAFLGGYAASVFTWSKMKEWINGTRAEIDSLKAKIEVLKGKL